jgi:putative FmdB family regulatory protein
VPLYDYTCGECGAAFDALVPAGQADRERCRDCGAEARRLLSLVAAPVRGSDGAAMPVARGGGCCGGACGNC